MPELNPSQKRIKARTILSEMALGDDLSNLSPVLDQLLSLQPAEFKPAVNKDELSELVQGVSKGTADNKQIARFLELAKKLGVG